MATKNTNFNVTFDKTTQEILGILAHKENKPVAQIIEELTLEALEMREDLYLSKIAEQIDIPGAKSYSHDETIFTDKKS